MWPRTTQRAVPPPSDDALLLLAGLPRDGAFVEVTLAQDENAMPFHLDDQPTFEDIGVRPVGHVASPRGLELVSMEGRHADAASHEMTSLGWMLHTFITPPKGTLRIDSGREFELPRFLFLPPDAPLQWRSDPATTHVCLFGPEFINALVDTEPGFSLDALDCVVSQGSNQLTALVHRAYTESCAPGFGAELLAEAIGVQVALEVVRTDSGLAPNAAHTRGGLAPWQLRRLEAYVHEHLADELSLQGLAEVVGISARHLSRVVKQEKGVSVHRWVADLRLAEAQRLLAETNQPLQEIAHRAAFKSAAAFSAAFRSACGLSPSEYRRLAFR